MTSPLSPEAVAQMVATLLSFNGDGYTRFNGKTMCESAADMLTTLAAENATLRASEAAARAAAMAMVGLKTEGV